MTSNLFSRALTCHSRFQKMVTHKLSVEHGNRVRTLNPVFKFSEFDYSRGLPVCKVHFLGLTYRICSLFQWPQDLNVSVASASNYLSICTLWPLILKICRYSMYCILLCTWWPPLLAWPPYQRNRGRDHTGSGQSHSCVMIGCFINNYYMYTGSQPETLTVRIQLSKFALLIMIVFLWWFCSKIVIFMRLIILSHCI